MNKKDNVHSSVSNVEHLIASCKNRAIESIELNNQQEARTVIDELMVLDETILISEKLSVIKDFLDIPGILLPLKNKENLEQLYLKGLAVLQKHKNARSSDVIFALNHLMILYYQVDDFEGVTEMANHIVSIADEIKEPLTPYIMEIFLNLGEVFENSDEPGAVEILYKQVNRFMIESAEIPNDSLLAWLHKYSRFLISQDQFDLSMEQFQRALTKLDKNSKENSFDSIMMLSAMAGFAFSQGKNAIAETAFKKTLQMAKKTGYEDRLELSAVNHNLANLYMQKSNHEDYVKAEALIKRSLEIEVAAGKQDTARYAGELAQLAVIVESMGEFGKAENIYNESFQIYETAFDTDKNEYSDFVSDSGFLYLRQQKSADAISMFKKALDLRKTVLDGPVNKLADAFSNLALAHFKSNNFDDAISNYREAIEERHKTLNAVH